MNELTKDRPLLPEDVRAALEHVIDYLWDEERVDYEERSAEERSGHLFESLCEVARWFNAAVRHDEAIRRTLDSCGEGKAA